MRAPNSALAERSDQFLDDPITTPRSLTPLRVESDDTALAPATRSPGRRLRPVGTRAYDERARYAMWRTSAACNGELVRWEHGDGRWVTIALGEGAHAGNAVVCSSDGLRRLVDSFEAALALAASWRSA
jgi:hypothetical protein